MDNILSTLKGEYARTLILILIPGAIAFEPFAVILYKTFSLKIHDLQEYITIVVIIYFFASIFLGFILQDIASRFELILDKHFCRMKKRSKETFNSQFELYLFNKKEEDFIITHYYRSMLVRMRFELHTCASLIVLWIGGIFRIIVEPKFKLDCGSSFWYFLITLSVFTYLLFEAFKGVETLHYLRIKINRKFKPSLKPE